MNELPRQRLLEIVAKHGRSVIDNPRRLEGLLRDYCGKYRREVSVLVMAVEEHAVLDLIAGAKSVPLKILLARLAGRLCDNLALSEPAARWSIESWALALGLISNQDIPAQTSPPEILKNSNLPTSSIASAAVKPVPIAAVSQPGTKSFIVAAAGGDFTSISEALRKAPPNSRLLVREGIYHESIVLDKRIEIHGDGAVEKIIVRSSQASALIMQTENATVRGLTFEGCGSQIGKSFFTVQIPSGELILENCHITSDSLSGVAVFGAGANPLIKNCRIYNCADSGLYIFEDARPQIENCDVYRNANVGIAITKGANPILRHNRIFAGGNGGIVAWGKGTTGLAEDCRIYGHRLANVGVREYANPLFRRCRIYGGQDTGIYVSELGYGTFEDCEIYLNARAQIAVEHNENSIFSGCRIHHGEDAGIIIREQGRGQIGECLIYDNGGAGIDISGASRAAISRCRINRNRRVAIRIKEQSQATVENCDLSGNLLAAWETERGVFVKDSNNRTH